MPATAGMTATDVVMSPSSPLTDNGNDYNFEGSGQSNKRGGGMTLDVIVTTEDDKDNGWDLALPPAAGATATDAAMSLSPPTDNRDD